jgi:predicted transcriptional regulator of viral defense system
MAASADTLLASNPVLSLDRWRSVTHLAPERVRERARYYTRTGRLRCLTRRLYAVVPPGADPHHFVPDPYLVAAALRPDAILSHHAALELLGVARSSFCWFTYLTARPRRPLKTAGMEWIALRHPASLTRKHEVAFGLVEMDRQGTRMRVTGAERTLVDGFAALPWVGGLEEHVTSAAAFRDLDPGVLRKYLHLLERRILYAAVGWFVESHPEVCPDAQVRLSDELERHVPRQPLYLGRRTRGARLVTRWNVLVPAHLASSGDGGGQQW